MDVNRLVEEYGNMISTIAHRMIQNKEIAREAAQEVWYELCKSFHSFKGDSDFLHGYILLPGVPSAGMRKVKGR